jgi:succinate-semialdehyde dehydrogenase / glutarate-semialdehyde dehydrogenase
MELGGRDPFIVLDDADLDTAVKLAVAGRVKNAGQTCIAAKRFIVPESIADAFLARFKDGLAQLQPGDPTDPETSLGPLCTEAALHRVLGQIDAAVSGGAKVFCGGSRPDRHGFFLEPTILTNVGPDNPAYRQEFFAPVAMVFTAKNEKEAVDLANDSPFGLGATVITRDVERGKLVARQIQSGMVFINEVTTTAPELPFGGVKNSGYGRELSHLGIGEFVNKKLIRVAA